MMKSILAALLASAVLAPAAFAAPAERAGRIDKRLSGAELRGAWVQGSPADHLEDRSDHREDIIDRRESRRDEAVDRNRRDVVEDVYDRQENRRDIVENRIDRRH